jgi:hypothetical protein
LRQMIRRHVVWEYRHEVRRDSQKASALGQFMRLQDRRHASSTGTDHDGCPRWIDRSTIQTGIPPRLTRRLQRILTEHGHLPRGLGIDPVAEHETAHLAGDLHWQIARIESLDPLDS